MTYEQEAFRELTREEVAAEKNAIAWLERKGVGLEKIRLLTFNSLDRERKTVRIRYESHGLIIIRNIPFSGSPLEEQIKMAENSGSRLWLFPKRGARGHQNTYTPNYRREEFEDFTEPTSKKPKNRLWTFVPKQHIIEINR